MVEIIVPHFMHGVTGIAAEGESSLSIIEGFEENGVKASAKKMAV